VEDLLKQIIDKLNSMDKKLNSMDTDLNSRLDRIEIKLDAVHDQTADLTEFRTETKDNMDIISKDVKFIKHKLHETEEDVFDIKDYLKIVK